MRLFIAINFEERFLDGLVCLQESLRSAGAAGNFTKRENLHLTLAFIGEYGNPGNVLDVMETVDFRPVEIRLDGVGHFREMYLAKVAENPGLQSYVRRLRRALADYDIPFDRKKFSPHITLIRKVSYLNGAPHIEDLPKATAKVSSISLMRSERGRNGMVYTEIGCVAGKDDDMDYFSVDE